MSEQTEKLPDIDLGAVSLVLGVLALALYGAMVVYIIAAGSKSLDQPTLNDVLAVGLLCLGGGCNLLGVSLGLGGLFQPNRSRTLAVSGLALNFLVIAPCCLLLALAILTA